MTTARPRLAVQAQQLTADAKRPSLATFELPASYSQRLAIMELGVNPRLCFAAAIGLCWRSAAKPAVRWTPGDPAAYGEAVFDDLVARPGVTVDEVLEVGGHLWEQIRDSLPTKDEVKEARGNSEQEAAPNA
jgi:hypothetical protein